MSLREANINCINHLVLLVSLLIKFRFQISLHAWLAKVDIHKKTKYKLQPKANGSFKIVPVKVESVFGGYLTVLAFYILAVGLITTILYVHDYHPLMIGENPTEPSQNSIRTSSVQDYNTQSKASQLANSIKDNLTLKIKVVLHNYQAYLKIQDLPLTGAGAITNCYDQSGDSCSWRFESSQSNDKHEAWFNLTLETIHLTSEALMTIPLTADRDFTYAHIEIEALALQKGQSFANFKQSATTYLVLPGENKTLTGTKTYTLSAQRLTIFTKEHSLFQ